MAFTLNQQQRELVLREGAFIGIKTLQERGELTTGQAAHVIKSVCGAIKTEIAEARNEINRLSSALATMESHCHAASVSSGTAQNSAVSRLTESYITFDAWAVSLMETSLTVAGLMNPGHTRKKINEFSQAMNALMDKRAAAGHPVMDDPSLFRGYVDR